MSDSSTPTPATTYVSTSDTLTSLEPIQAVKRSPRTELGSNGVDGVFQGFKEIVINAVDATVNVISRTGSDTHADGTPLQIRVSVFEDGSYEVSDDGDGIPLMYSEKNDTYGWKMIYLMPDAGGNMNDEERHEYLNSLSSAELSKFSFDAKHPVRNLASGGVHGRGSWSVNATSAWSKVTAHYADGVSASMSFAEGYPDQEELTVGSCEPNRPGTTYRWRPDDYIYPVFSDANIPIEDIKKFLLGVSFRIPVTLTLADGSVIEYPKVTPELYLQTITGDNSLVGSETIVVNGKDNQGNVLVSEIDIAVAPALKVASDSESDSDGDSGDGSEVSKSSSTPVGLYLVNFISVERGILHSKLSEAVTRFFRNVVAKDFNSKGENISFSKNDIDSLFHVVVSVRATTPNYGGGQMKTELPDVPANKYIGAGISKMTSGLLNKKRAEGAKWFKMIVDYAVSSAKSREVYARQYQVVEELYDKSDSKNFNVPKGMFTSEAYTAGRYDESQIIIVEGESAIGNVALERKSLYQSLYALTGKIINAYKQPLEAVMTDKVIFDIITMFGCGVVVPDKLSKDLEKKMGSKAKFSIDKFRFKNGIYLASDADVDGAHINHLVVNFIACYMPALITEGYVFVIKSPLYRLEFKKDGRVEYLEDAKALNKWYADVKASGVEEPYKLLVGDSPTYNKGLGEMDRVDIEKYICNPDSRAVVPLTFDPASKDWLDYVDVMFADDTSTRKREFVSAIVNNDPEMMASFEHAHKEAQELLASMSVDDSELEVVEV